MNYRPFYCAVNKQLLVTLLINVLIIHFNIATFQQYPQSVKSIL
jgi:hypothetical protein